jgi:hypothetical protein
LSWKYPQDILQRKLAYLKKLASEDAVNIIADNWINTLTDIQSEISYETIWRSLMDLYLSLSLQMDWSQFDFTPFPVDWNIGDFTEPPLEGGGKAFYDISYYDLSVYDPPEIVYKDLERYAWESRYKVSEKHTLEYKRMSKALKDELTTRGDLLKSKDITPYFVDMVEDTLTMVESRLLRSFYVGFAVVGLSRVAEPHPPEALYRAPVPTRLTTDWKTVIDTESVTAWECLVGFSRVGYTRVGSWRQVLTKQVSDEIVKRINEFWLRSGMVEAGYLSPYGGIEYYRYPVEKVKTLWQRIFMLQRVDQYHYTGGDHQLKMQFNIKRIKPILDSEGVIGSMRGMYVAFANELFYLYHDSHRLYKRYKKVLTEDDVMQKYIRFGCDESVLRKIRGMVKP